MKEIKLEIKGSYKEVVEFINKNYNITEPTVFLFTQVKETNAKMRRYKEWKGIYKYEVDSHILLNDDNHKRNLYNKVCGTTIKQWGYSQSYMARMGVD